MKVKRKILLLVLGILLVAFSICGLFSVSRFKAYSMEILVESEREKLNITTHAFRQVGTREDYEKMGEAARDAYLKYQFKRCYESGYVLLKNGACISNLTEYQVVNPNALTEEYMIQELSLTNPEEKRQLLLLKHSLEYPVGYEVLAVKDITPAWNLLEQQIYLLLAVFGVFLLLAALLTIVSVGVMLRGIEELKLAANAVAVGELGCVVPVRSKDEIGQVSEAFNQMSRQIEQQVNDLHLLLGALAHEMKTPITTILGYADSLMHVKLSEQNREKALQSIYNSGKRMEIMSSKLLSLIGMYENNTIEKKRILLLQILQQVKEETRETLEKKYITFILNCDSRISVEGDETLLVSLFSNLVSNSCKACEPGGCIQVEAEKNKVTVIDNGRGIPEKEIPYVTGAFYMADKSRSRSEGGSGLGLALGLRIAELHHATLHISSKEGEGTRVTVEFLTEQRKNDRRPE